MAAAVPPRPSSRIPRPDRSSRTSAAPTVRRLPTKSEPRLSLHSVDFEVVEQTRSDSHQRATLLHPLGEDDPLDVVMDALRGVRCLRAVEAASVCLAATVRAGGCRAAIAHLWDAHERDFVIVYAVGPNAHLLLNARHGADDALLTEGLRQAGPARRELRGGPRAARAARDRRRRLERAGGAGDGGGRAPGSDRARRPARRLLLRRPRDRRDTLRDRAPRGAPSHCDFEHRKADRSAGID